MHRTVLHVDLLHMVFAVPNSPRVANAWCMAWWCVLQQAANCDCSDAVNFPSFFEISFLCFEKSKRRFPPFLPIFVRNSVERAIFLPCQFKLQTSFTLRLCAESKLEPKEKWRTRPAFVTACQTRAVVATPSCVGHALLAASAMPWTDKSTSTTADCASRRWSWDTSEALS